MASQTTNPNPQTWDEIQASIANGGCPGCGGRPGRPTSVAGVVHCQRCGGIFGSCAAAEAQTLVRSEWSTDPEADSRAIGFDLTITDLPREQGGGRRHGWFDPTTKRITQTG